MAPTRIAIATCKRAFERTNARRAAVEAASERLGRIVIARRVSPSCLDLWTIRKRAGSKKNPRPRFRRVRVHDITKLSGQFVLGAAADGEHSGKSLRDQCLDPDRALEDAGSEGRVLAFQLETH